MQAVEYLPPRQSIDQSQAESTLMQDFLRHCREISSYREACRRDQPRQDSSPRSSRSQDLRQRHRMLRRRTSS